MKIRESRDADEIAINLTPMIDVVFQLVIFFMVTTTFAKNESEIEVELPAAESAGELKTPPEELVITVQSDGSVYLRGEARAPADLRALLRAAAERDPATSVMIRGDRAARHEAIVDVMDACGSAGLHNLSVGTTAVERGG